MKLIKKCMLKKGEDGKIYALKNRDRIKIISGI